jgi:hypothetical protein
MTKPPPDDAGFLLEPDQIEDPDRPERSRPVRLVGTGLAPTALVPTSRRSAPDTPAAYVACSCGVMILAGVTATGQRVVVETTRPTWSILWQNGTPTPTMAQSRAYVEHHCATRGGNDA